MPGPLAARTLTPPSSSVILSGVVTLVAGLVCFAMRKQIAACPPDAKKRRALGDRAEASLAGQECRLVKNNALLLVLSNMDGTLFKELADGFCGTIIKDVTKMPSVVGMTVYVCGDLSKVAGLGLGAAKTVYIVRQLSFGGTCESHVFSSVDLGRVPLLVHGVGVFYRRFFDLSIDCFRSVCNEHAFQTLTESNKPATAHRTGIYLTPVEEKRGEAHFRLLRCSTNFAGPTVNFGRTDHRVVDALNHEASRIFHNPAPLNHILAQIYHNTPASSDQKQTKAKIKAHADKTKDMPVNGLIVFCTFYEKLDRLQPMGSESFDYGHTGKSGLTKLHFRLKECVARRPGCDLQPQFSVTLYPNSAFFIPLSTNRLYTHEIRPAALDAALLPVRMGYVVRCSEAEAVHKDGQTFVKMLGGEQQLEPATPEGMANLRTLYAEENSIDAFIDYSKHGPIQFSMNQGDYAKPAVDHLGNEFRALAVRVAGNPFEELLASVRFDGVCKGRAGTVLVKPDRARGIPIVRTTTKYNVPAQTFKQVHEDLAQQIQDCALLSCCFNNALIEHYTNAYATMGFHSDQELDLEDDTFIAVFSCYKYAELASPPSRKLVIESKEVDGCSCEIPMAHNGVVVFSTQTNRRFKHKIVLDTSANRHDNEWLGITFRTSKTFIQVQSGVALFEDGTQLMLADEAQRKEFYSLRRRENEFTDFRYRPLAYTISESDLVVPL